MLIYFHLRNQRWKTSRQRGGGGTWNPDNASQVNGSALRQSSVSIQSSNLEQLAEGNWLAHFASVPSLCPPPTSAVTCRVLLPKFRSDSERQREPQRRFTPVYVTSLKGDFTLRYTFPAHPNSTPHFQSFIFKKTVTSFGRFNYDKGICLKQKPTGRGRKQMTKYKRGLKSV